MKSIDREQIRITYEKNLLNNTPKIPNDDVPYKYISSLLGDSRDVKILDAACGNGRYALKLTNDGYPNVYAFDLFDKLPYRPQFKYVKSSLDSIQYPDGKFDIIICVSALFYLDKPLDGINEFYRLLKHGGKVIITAHTKYSLFTLWRIVKRHIKPESVSHLKGVKFYSACQYTQFFNQVGFRVIVIDGYQLLPFEVSKIIKKVFMKVEKVFPVVKSISIFKNHMCLAMLRATFGYHLILVAEKG